jgi:hypothetical protein
MRKLRIAGDWVAPAIVDFRDGYRRLRRLDGHLGSVLVSVETHDEVQDVVGKAVPYR